MISDQLETVSLEVTTGFLRCSFSSQRHHGARLQVKVRYRVCDGADAAAGGARSHLVLPEALQITLQDKQEV